MSRIEELKKIIDDVDSNVKILIYPLLEEIVFLEEQMNDLKKMPFIRVNPNNNTLQKPTTASKQYKECSQSYMNAIRILCGLLTKQDNSAENELFKKLEEFL